MFRAAVTLLLLIALVGAALAPMHPAHADDASPVDSVAGNLMCQCGCGLVVSACAGTMECSIGDQIKAIIRQQLGQGKTSGEVIAYFQQLYGEGILAAPKKSGFSLTAWVTPFAAIAVAGVALGGFVWLWASRRRPQPGKPPEASEAGRQRDAYDERVERELETLR